MESKAKKLEEAKHKVLMAITRHVGASQKIPMTALFERVYGVPWADKINDTRRLREAITALRRDGVPILSDASHTSGGYYLASAGSELETYIGKLRTRALKILRQAAKIKNQTLPEMLGQMSIEDAAQGGEEGTL